LFIKHKLVSQKEISLAKAAGLIYDVTQIALSKIQKGIKTRSY